jgi:hypothetical protein
MIWTCVFNTKCLIKPSILNATSSMDPMSNTLIFVKHENMFLLYKYNNPWIMNFNVKVLFVLMPLVKN